jgi:hypothetical protein
VVSFGVFAFAWLLEFYVFFGVAAFDEELSDSVAVVSLQHDLAVFGGSSAGAKSFQFLS